MKTISILGAGSPAGIGIARCLKEHYDVSGYDDSKYASLMIEVPSWKDDCADMKIASPDSIVKLSSFRPPIEQIELCQDKAKTAEVLGDLAPKTYWMRDTVGAGGKGAQMLSEYLPGGNYSVEHVIYHGEILASFQKKRLSYSVKYKTDGLENRGTSAVSICSNNEDVWDCAIQALKRLPGTLNGFYGVDLKCDEHGMPKVTEINAGRLLTASYPYFYKTGYNLPLIGVQAFLGDPVQSLPEYPEGWGLIWQLGQEPRLFPPEVTKDWI